MRLLINDCSSAYGRLHITRTSLLPRLYDHFKSHMGSVHVSTDMAQLLAEAEFIEADVTYKASIEFEYLFNVVVFNYTTLRCK